MFLRSLSLAAVAALVTALLTPLAPAAHAAVATSCLCRTDDGKSWREQLTRHHKWACDYHFGYVRSSEPGEKPDPNLPDQRRPGAETCNAEEVIQWKVYHCVAVGCTYTYSKSSSFQNRGLKKILPLKGERRP